MASAATSTPTTAPSFPLTAGRRAALAVGVPVCLALVGAGAFSLVSNLGEGSYAVGHKFPASVKSLDVSVDGGQLTVAATTARQATLTGTAHYGLVRSQVTMNTTTGGKTTIGYRCPLPVNNCALDATVNVPAALPVTANTGGGNATVTGTVGQVSLDTAGGDLTADDVSGELALNTGGGNIQATDITSNTMTVNTAGGEINATGIGSPTVTATTGGGNIVIDFNRVPKHVSVGTAGGDITLVLPPGHTAYTIVPSTAGGSFSDGGITTSASSPNTIAVSSGGGNITIRQQ